jgi:protein-L-isoaspartate(D-aspartate) O-methyltransferase
MVKMNYKEKRENMVKKQLVERGINDERLLEAIRKIPRHLFVSEEFRALSYSDRPLPINEEQTISQPYIVALMTQCLEIKKEDKILEIGTGSGYQTAILAELGKEVYTVERINSLYQKASSLLKDLGYENIHFKLGNGSLGWQEFAPYDGIIVTAGAPEVPESLLDQLEEGGRLVIPVGGKYSQDLLKITKNKGKINKESVCGCIFVPLLGEHGWKENGKHT